MPLPKVEDSINDLCQWLDSISLSHHKALFREHGVDGRALLLLHSAELKEMGIRGIGDRVKILNAIDTVNKQLRAQPPPAAPVRPGPNLSSSYQPRAAAQSNGQTRQVSPLYATVE